MASYYDRPPPRDRGYDYGGPPPPSAADPYYPDPATSASRRPRRGSILVDPAERDRGGPRRRHRSQSQVRLQEPEFDDSSDDDARYHHSSAKPRSGPAAADPGHKVRHRDGRVEYAAEDAGVDRKTSSARRPKPRTRVSDLEEKDGPQFRDFRARRDGFEAEEGRTHRNLKSSRGDKAIYDDGENIDPYDLGGPGGGPPGRDGHAPPSAAASSSRRGGPDSYDIAIGAGVGAAGAGAAARSARRHEEPRRPRDRPPPTYHDEAGDRGYTSDAPKSRRTKDRAARQSLPPDYNRDRDRDRGDRYGGGAPPPPRADHHSSRRHSPPPAAYKGPSPDRGARYDAPPPAPSSSSRGPGHRRGASLPPRSRYDDDPYGGPPPVRSGSTRHGPRGGAEEKSRARSAAYPQDPYNDFNDRRGGGGRHYPRDPRAPYEEVSDPRRPRGGKGGPGGTRGAEAVKKERTVPPWAKKAGGFLVSTAVPIIKQEGEKYLRKEMERRFQK